MGDIHPGSSGKTGVVVGLYITTTDRIKNQRAIQRTFRTEALTITIPIVIVAELTQRTVRIVHTWGDEALSEMLDTGAGAVGMTAIGIGDAIAATDRVKFLRADKWNDGAVPRTVTVTVGFYT